MGLLSTVKVHVEDTGGPGRPVVLIHGWPLSGESWSEQVPALTSAGFRVVRYDRRGFGRSDKTATAYDYDALAGDLHKLMTELDLNDASLVGFSMGGGEVARYVATYGQDRLRSVVFAGAVPPYLAKTDDNPRGPLDGKLAADMKAGLTNDRDGFFDEFMTDFFSADGVLKVGEAQRQEALALCRQSDPKAALGCLEAFATTDFRHDLTTITVPTLVIHGTADAIVPVEGSGELTHRAVAGSDLVLVNGGPHGFNVSHATEFNTSLVDFLNR